MKIKETRTRMAGGLGQSGRVATETRVIDFKGTKLPKGAVRVPDTTPVTDWQEKK